MKWRSTYTFSGFPEGRSVSVSLPEQVFTELVPHIDNLEELQVTLLLLRRLSQMRGEGAPWVTVADLVADPAIRVALDEHKLEAQLEDALARAVARGTLLEVEYPRADGKQEMRYFANSPSGRATVRALQRGEVPSRIEVAERPNIYTLYEQNIGTLTALLSEELMEAEKAYPPEWIEEAFREAVRLKKRNWKYILAILENWKARGKDEIDRRDRAPDTRSYTEGKYGHLIEH